MARSLRKRTGFVACLVALLIASGVCSLDCFGEPAHAGEAERPCHEAGSGSAPSTMPEACCHAGPSATVSVSDDGKTEISVVAMTAVRIGFAPSLAVPEIRVVSRDPGPDPNHLRTCILLI